MIIDCLAVRDSKIEEYRKRLEKLEERPKLTILIVGDNDASKVYVRNKQKLAEEIGIVCDVIKVKSDISQERLIKLIEELNIDQSVTGILLQLPLPVHIDEAVVTNMIDASKDVDGFTDENIGKVFKGTQEFTSCTPQAIMSIFKHHNIELTSKNVLIASRSNIVGKPLALLCINAGATVTVANSKTKDIKRLIKDSDIFISAIGRSKYFTKDYFQSTKDLVVIDVGINRDENNKLCGDIDTAEVESLVQMITPVPKGVGVLTVTEVLNNLITIKEKM